MKKKNLCFDFKNKNLKMMKLKCSAAVLFTGGKDSCLALHLAKQKYNIKYLLTILPRNPDSFMFHKPYLNLLKMQAKMLDIKLITRKSNRGKERELEDLKKLIKKVKNKVEVIITGGIASSYQGKRIKKICEEVGLEFYAPLWNYNPEQVWEELLNKKFKIILTKIACEGIPRKFLWKVIDKKMFEELKKLSEKYKFRLDFEGGEAETAILGMPEFKKPIDIKYNIKSEGEYRHFLKLEKVE